jgi:ribosomal protein S27AE
VLEKLAEMGNNYAKEVLDARKALKEIELYDKLIIAGRLHASLKVAGTLSNRMAGADGLNVQAINNLGRVRSLFPLANFSGHTECQGCKVCSSKDKETGRIKFKFRHAQYNPVEYLSQGDFESFEVVIAEAIYGDPNLRADLLTCEDCGGEMKPHKLTFQCGKCGGANAKKIHALMGMSLYPGNDYEQVKKSKSTAVDMYTNGKRGVFALLYGGTAFTIATKIGVSIEIAERALEDFVKKYLKVGIARSEVASRFTALRQPGGIGSKVIYSQPAEFVENIYGFKRFFTLENLVIKRLFELSNNLPGSLGLSHKT